MVDSAARPAAAVIRQDADGFVWSIYLPAADAPDWHDGYPELHRNEPHPCEGCGKKYAPTTYRHRWRCASCAKDVLDGVTIIDSPEHPHDYQPEPRWRHVSPEAYLARRATYERFCETWRLRLCEQAPDAPWLRTWDQPLVPTDSLGRPWRFLFREWRCVQNCGNLGWNSDDDCYWHTRPVPGRLPFRMRIVICHYPQLHTWHLIVAEPTVHLPRHRGGGYDTGTFTIAERVESTTIGTRQGSATWVGKRVVLQEVRARLAALDNTAKGRPYRWHRPGHGRTWRPQVTPPLRPGTSRQRTPRLERRHQSPGIPMALPVKPSPGWEANDALDSETGDLASLVGETTASEASTWLGIRHRLQRQQPPARQSRLLVQHPRRHILLRPVEDTSRAQPPCRRQLTAAFYCNRRPKRLLLERGCTDGTGPWPSLEP